MIESRRSDDSLHWTNDQLIAHLYGVGPEDGHAERCEECRSRLANMAVRRERSVATPDVSFEQLAAQRRKIYEAISQPGSWWTRLSVWRWAPAGAAAVALAAGLFYFGEQHAIQQKENAISDAQLAQEVSQLSDGSEARPTAPLQGLFVQ